MLGALILYIVLVICGCVIAAVKNRSALGWFLIVLFFSPLTILILLCLPRINDYEEKVCGACAETIRREAKVCKHCGAVQPELIAPESRIDTFFRRFDWYKE